MNVPPAFLVMRAGAPEAAEMLLRIEADVEELLRGRERPDCQLAFVTLKLVLSG